MPNTLDWYIREAMQGRHAGSAATYAFQSYSGYRLASSLDSWAEPGPGPRAFVHFIVKVASRCNIKCSYCYMYEHADQTWRTQPRHMTDRVESAVIGRIGDYLEERSVPQALVVLHGGEPLLYGPHRITRFAERLRAERERRGIDVELALQTNATLVDSDWLDLFARHHINVGVSLDGPPQIHDEHRRDKQGGGTYDRAAAGLRQLLAGGSETPPAVTAVIDPAARPGDLIRHFLALGVEHVDFQLPDLHHDTYPHDVWPPGTFGTWLIELFEELRRLRQPFRVRSMELLVSLLLGAPYGGDIWGTRSFGTLIVEADGTYHAHDALKATVEGATATGASVWTDTIRSLEAHPMVLAHTDKATAASDSCRACPLFDVCGGGLVAHRYSAAGGYDNPSVYCTDLAMLIRHVADSVEQLRPLAAAR